MTDLRRRCQIGVLLLVLGAPFAAADVPDAVNAVRYAGCGGHHGVPPVRESAALDEVAHRLSQGTDLSTAQRFAGYHAVSSFSVSISNVPPSGDIEAIITRQFCAQVTDPAFREIGAWRRGSDVWIALAQPFRPPSAGDLAAVSGRVLELTNQARAQSRRCGPTPYAAVPPLTLNATLGRAALAYARDMALFGYMSHTGRDGSTPAARITRSGYRWREMGENLASGVMSADEVVNGWLHSPEHCANLMDPLYRELGVAFAVNMHNDAGVYWAMELGTPP
jgi:uncharacterized protein YkwD